MKIYQGVGRALESLRKDVIIRRATYSRELLPTLDLEGQWRSSGWDSRESIRKERADCTVLTVPLLRKASNL